jgi:DNA-binding transcriptional regulator LsrR (DeoR family)
MTGTGELQQQLDIIRRRDEIIREAASSGGFTNAEIARRTGISRPTIIRIVKEGQENDS